MAINHKVMREDLRKSVESNNLEEKKNEFTNESKIVGRRYRLIENVHRCEHYFIWHLWPRGQNQSTIMSIVRPQREIVFARDCMTLSR